MAQSQGSQPNAGTTPQAQQAASIPKDAPTQQQAATPTTPVFRDYASI